MAEVEYRNWRRIPLLPGRSAESHANAWGWTLVGTFAVVLSFVAISLIPGVNETSAWSIAFRVIVGVGVVAFIFAWLEYAHAVGRHREEVAAGYLSTDRNPHFATVWFGSDDYLSVPQVDSRTGVVIREPGELLLTSGELRNRLSAARTWASENPESDDETRAA